MLPYAIIMLSVSLLCFVLGALVYRGNTDLIHDYHQTKVKDKAAYGKAFGKAFFVVAAAPLVSGVIALLGDSKTIMTISVVLLVCIMLAGIGCIIAVQRKYNQGVF